jgi:uncharacterized membrane protein YccC
MDIRSKVMSEQSDQPSEQHMKRFNLTFALSIFGVPIFSLLSLMAEPESLPRLITEICVFIFIGLGCWSYRSLWVAGKIKNRW